jgi:hypothetical protein
MPAILIGKDKALKNEKKTVQSIANNLGDDWYVLVPARKVSTEGDVVLVNKDHLIFIEIKNSVVKYQKGGFLQQNRNTKTWKNIDPIAQLDNVFHDLMKYKNKMFETSRYVPTNYFICTPESHSAGIPDEISNNLSQIHLGNLNKDLENFIKNNSKKFDRALSAKEIKNIVNTIVPDGDYLSIIKSIEGVVEERIVEATVQQKRVLKSLGETKALSVLGGAGTGKTVLAIDIAKRRLKDNPSKKYIFACYTNRLYRDYLSNSIPRNIFGGTITQILIKVSRVIFNKIGIDYDEFKNYISQHENSIFSEFFEGYEKEYEAFVLSNMIKSSNLNKKILEKYKNVDLIDFDKMSNELIKILDADSKSITIAKNLKEIISEKKISLESDEFKELVFDGIFCDEAQDISPPWFLFLSNLVVQDNFELYVFYDLNQKVLGKSEFKTPLELIEIDLNQTGNCRSTDQIAIFANLVLKDDKTMILRNIYGKNVEVKSNKNLDFLCQSIENEVKQLLEAGVNEKNIAILYSSSTSELASNVDSFFEKKYLHLQKDKRDSSGNIDSIRRFKGLEKKYVFLIIESSEFNENKKLVYVGATRATTQLQCMVLVNDDYDLNELKEEYTKQLSNLINH